MSTPAVVAAPEALHPSLWLASQLARASTPTVDTGYVPLSAQLPGGGWPLGTLIDLLVQQPGVGEIRMLAPALGQVAGHRIVMLQPPHAPQALGLAALGVPPSQIIWLRTERTADALWAAEQVLKSGSCGALLYWPGGERREHMRGDSLRHPAPGRAGWRHTVLYDEAAGHGAGCVAGTTTHDCAAGTWRCRITFQSPFRQSGQCDAHSQ